MNTATAIKPTLRRGEHSTAQARHQRSTTLKVGLIAVAVFMLVFSFCCLGMRQRRMPGIVQALILKPSA